MKTVFIFAFVASLFLFENTHAFVVLRPSSVSRAAETAPLFALPESSSTATTTTSTAPTAEDAVVTTPPSPARIQFNKFVRDSTWIIFQTYSFAMTFAALTAIAGVALNLSGYAWSMDHGWPTVDTLEHLRLLRSH